MGVLEDTKKTWTLKQMFGFFFFFVGILTIAVALDYGSQNIFSENQAVVGLFQAFILFAFVLIVAVTLYVLINALQQVMNVKNKYKTGR